MNKPVKSVKGAMAAGAAVALLLGGAGSLAYWTDSKDVGTANIKSGNISLSVPDCTTAPGSHDWEMDTLEAFVPGTTKLVPGDSVSKICDMTLVLTGEHIGSTLTIGTPTLSDAGSTLDTELVATATFLVDGLAYAPITDPTAHTVRATITVTLPTSVTSTSSQNGTAALSAITVVASQTHP